MRTALIFTSIALLVLLLGGCKKQESAEASMYDTMVAGSWDIGITLKMTEERVREVLGEPQYTATANNKISTDLIWIPEQTDAHGLEDSQLRVTMTDGEVTRILCRRRVPVEEGETVYDPPFIVKVAPGCTLGALKTDFVAKLGPASEERSDDMVWDFQSAAGDRLRITASFEMDESIGVATCQAITIQTGKRLAGSMAEDKKPEPTI